MSTMFWTRKVLAPAIAVVFIAAIAFSASVARAGNGAGGPGADGTTAVPRKEVCMVTDRVFAKEQIPVEYGGKTYYGCCMGCVSRIKNERAVRYATDPVTGAEVDKATAYIAEGAGGEALYFESVETAAAYAGRGQGR